MGRFIIDTIQASSSRCTDGSDAYENAKKIGRFKLIKRTEGVSSTDIVGRMLMCTRNNPRLGAEVNPCLLVKPEIALSFPHPTCLEVA